MDTSFPSNDQATENLKYWTAMAEVDKKFLKPIQGRRYGGSSPDPQYMMRKFISVFGPPGRLWTFAATYPDPIYLDDGTILAFADVCLIFDAGAFGDELGPAMTVGPERGCEFLRRNEKSGPFVDDDAYKKAHTDALTKLMSRLGNCSDLYMGLHDANKYRSTADNRPPVSDEVWQDRIDVLIKLAQTAKTADDLTKFWSSPSVTTFRQEAPAAFIDNLTAVVAQRGKALKETESDAESDK